MNKSNSTQPGTSFRQKIILIISGIFFFVISLELGLRLGGFIFLSLQEYRNRIAIKQKNTYRIMCLGESTTAGGDFSYPFQLEEILNQRDTGIRFTVINKGVPGINTAYILTSLEDNLNQYQPDMVITMMGANDGRDSMAYRDIPNQRARALFNSLRTYKLIKLLKLHIINKAEELGIYKPREINELGYDEFGRVYKEQDKYRQAEAIFKKARESSPSDGGAYVALGEWYRDQGKYTQAEEMFKKAIELDPRKVGIYVQLGWCHKESYERPYDKAILMLKKAIETNPNEVWPYVGLGYFYKIQGKYAQAEVMFKKAIALNPESDGVYIELGWLYKDQGKHAQVEAMFKQAITKSPRNIWVYIELGRYYRDQGKYTQAEEAFNKVIEIDPRKVGVYIELGRCYQDQKKYIQAEEAFKKTIEINPRNFGAYVGLAHCYEEQGKSAAAKEYTRKVNKLRLEYYNPITRNGYQKLKEILTNKGIQLVCAQYPVRSLEPLKKIFEDQEGVIFVSNERVFKQALKQASYKEYFTDMFGSDFGHCTPKGNRLLAENIANVILKEYFNIRL
ncbi:MAG: tetratricopeptide repeat protein [Candidatus Omnitrophota bacterium]